MAATVLHVGDDICHRIPVMEMSGIVVRRCDCSVDSVRALLKEEGSIVAVAFNNDICPPAEAVISTARELCDAPLILFENTSVECNDKSFDVVIEVPSEPSVWAKTLRQAIEDSGRLRGKARQRRADSAALRERAQGVCEMARSQSVSTVDCGRMFFGEADGAGQAPNDEGDAS